MLVVGTKEGLFLLASPDRTRWELTGPFHTGREINHAIYDVRTGTIFAVVNDAWFGCEISRSPDFGKSWQIARQNPAFAADSNYQLERIWHIEPGRLREPKVLYAGVAAVALFQSRDGGEIWSEVASLTNHPSRSRWQPGAGGLCLHSIAVDPAKQNRMFVGISAVGVFAPMTGEKPGHPQTREHAPNFSLKSFLNSASAFTSCFSPATTVRFFSSRIIAESTAAASWEPLNKGLPQRDAYVGVCRESMATDSLDSAGVYFGTSTGKLFGSNDQGDSSRVIADNLPPIYSVSATVL